MTAAEIRVVIIQALNEALVIPGEIQPRMADPNADVRFDEFEIDSLSATEIAMAIEDEAGYVCDLGDFLAYPSVQALAAHIAGRLSTTTQ